MVVRSSWLALFLLASCSTPPSPVVMPAGDEALPEEELSFAVIGDTLLITDFRNPTEWTLSKRIDIDGTVLLPELGALPVAGYTSSEIEQLLARQWAPYYPQLDLHVEIVARQARTVPAARGPVEGGGLLEGFRAWLRVWFLPPPILIAVGEPR